MTTTDSRPGTEQGEGEVLGRDKPTAELHADAAGWLGLIRQCDAKIAELEDAKLTARQHIERMLGDAEVGTINGQPAVRWTVVPSKRLDTKKLKAERPEVYEAFARTSVTRRFTLVEPE